MGRSDPLAFMGLILATGLTLSDNITSFFDTSVLNISVTNSTHIPFFLVKVYFFFLNSLERPVLNAGDGMIFKVPIALNFETTSSLHHRKEGIFICLNSAACLT